MKAFIFDMDGVLIDSEPLHIEVKLETFRHFGIPFPPEKLPSFPAVRARISLLRRCLRIPKQDSPGKNSPPSSTSAISTG